MSESDPIVEGWLLWFGVRVVVALIVIVGLSFFAGRALAWW